MKWLARILALFGGTFALTTVIDEVEEVTNMDSGETLTEFTNGLQGIFFTPIIMLVKAMIEKPKAFFTSIGSQLFDSIGLTPETIFSANFVYLFIGIVIGIMILKYMITVAVEFISKLLDPA